MVPMTKKEKRKYNAKSILFALLQIVLVIALLFVWRFVMPYLGCNSVTAMACYVIIVAAMTAILEVLMTLLIKLTTKDPLGFAGEEITDRFRFWHSARAIVGAIFYSGFFACSHALVFQFFGRGLPHDGRELQSAFALLVERDGKQVYEFEWLVPLFLAVLGFSWFMRHSTKLFTNTEKLVAGSVLFRVAEAVVGIALPILLASFLPGVWAAVIALVLDLVLFTLLQAAYYSHRKIDAPFGRYAIKNGIYVIVLVALLFISRLIGGNWANEYKEVLINGLLSVGFSVIACAIMVILDKNFRIHLSELFSKKEKQ